MAIRLPYTTVNILSAAVQARDEAQKVLIICQKGATGSAVSGELIENIPNDNSYLDLLGLHSQGAAMVRQFKAINPKVRLDIIPFDGDGIAANGSYLVGGAATEDGEITLVAGDERFNRYTISIEDGDIAADIAFKFVDAIDSDDSALVVGVNNLGTLELSALNIGLEGNFLTLRVIGIDTVSGLTIGTLTGMAGGTLAPDISSVPTVVGERRYQNIVMPSTFDVDSIRTWMETRFNPTNNVLDGSLIINKTDTVANNVTYGNTQNWKILNTFGNKKVDRSDFIGSVRRVPDYVLSSYEAAIASLRHSEEANISQYTLSAYGARDSFGGVGISSLPYHNTPFPDLPVTLEQDKLTQQEQIDLNNAGISFIDNNSSNTEVIWGDFVTTYKTDSESNPDITFKYRNYFDELTIARELFVVSIRKEFPQSRLTTGNAQKRRNYASPAIFKSFLVSIYRQLSTADYNITVDGNITVNGQTVDAEKYFTDTLDVQIEEASGKITAIGMQLPLVTQVRKVEASIQPVFPVYITV